MVKKKASTRKKTVKKVSAQRSSAKKKTTTARSPVKKKVEARPKFKAKTQTKTTLKKAPQKSRPATTAGKSTTPARKKVSPAARREKSLPVERMETASSCPGFSSESPAEVSARVPEQQQETPIHLPEGYGQERIIAQVRDPWWLHTYWEVPPAKVTTIQQRLGEAFLGAKCILRVYDITFIDFDGTNAHQYRDIDIPLEARNWYIDVGRPGSSWCIDIGFLLADGRFILIARSNTVSTPLDGPSDRMDEEWMIPDELFARLYGFCLSANPSSPTEQIWQKRRDMFLSSESFVSSFRPESSSVFSRKA